MLIDYRGLTRHFYMFPRAAFLSIALSYILPACVSLQFLASCPLIRLCTFSHIARLCVFTLYHILPTYVSFALSTRGVLMYLCMSPHAALNCIVACSHKPRTNRPLHSPRLPPAFPVSLRLLPRDTPQRLCFRRSRRVVIPRSPLRLCCRV